MKKLLLSALVLLLCGSTVAQERSLRVITYNIMDGFGWGAKDEARRAALCAWVGEQQPDVVALNELCQYTPEELQKDAERWDHPYSVLHKESGYSVGLTSKYPIETVEKITEGLHHGALHCRTAGVDFIATHLNPHEVAIRRREAVLLSEKILRIADQSDYYILLGDLNSRSPMDADQNERMSPGSPVIPDQSEQWTAMREPDYSVISRFMSLPLIDVVQRYTRGRMERGTFPTHILQREDRTPEMLDARRVRIDYMLVSPALGLLCRDARVCNGPECAMLSDHYPVMADFVLPAKK